MTVPDNAAIEHKTLELLSQRKEEASICPSDVARALLEDEKAWRGLMPNIRQVALMLAMNGRIVITRGSNTLNADHPQALEHGGPIRLRRGPHFTARRDSGSD